LSAASAEGTSRPSTGFAGAPMLLGVAFMTGIVLTVVFPSGREFAELTDKERVDAYSIAYLAVLTRAQQDDSNLRLAYTRQLAELGRWDEALTALDGTPPRERGSNLVPEIAGNAGKVRLELMLARARALPVDSAPRAAAFEEIHRALRAGASLTLPSARARELAALALELEDPALAARYFLAAAAAERNRLARALALAEAGRWLRASGDERSASESFRRAADLSDDEERKVSYLCAAADALEGQGRPCDAVDLLRPYVSVSRNVAVVERATALSTSCGNATDARQFGRLLRESAPDDERYVRAQVERELAAGDPAAALALLKRLVSSYPNDSELRWTTARVAEWSGQPQVALEQWLALVSSGHVRSLPPAR